MAHDHVIFASGGNDSIALIQFMYERDLRNCYILYSDTGWASAWWSKRIEMMMEFARGYGFTTVQIPPPVFTGTAPPGFPDLAFKKKGFPWNGHQWCTYELKVRPSLRWLDEIDPDTELTCVVGVRREESGRRAAFPEYTIESSKHGDRDLWAPLVRHTGPERNALLSRAGLGVPPIQETDDFAWCDERHAFRSTKGEVWDPHANPWVILPFRSQECAPCVNSNKKDFRALSTPSIQKIAALEEAVGQTMFRPARHKGKMPKLKKALRELIAVQLTTDADPQDPIWSQLHNERVTLEQKYINDRRAQGIHEVVAWARSGHGAFDIEDYRDTHPRRVRLRVIDGGRAPSDCDAGWCG